MGIWFVDSFDLQDNAHIGRKYKNPDNPHPKLEFQNFGFTSGFDTVLKRTGYQSFKGILQKWHGSFQVQVKMGIAFHSSTVGTGTWIRQFGGQLFYELIYENSGVNSGLRAESFYGLVAGPVPITIIDGWNYLEWSAAFHVHTPGQDYIHHVRLNGEDIFFGNPQTNLLLVDTYTNIRATLGNKDDYYVISGAANSAIHQNFLGPVRIVALRPIGNGVLNHWVHFPTERNPINSPSLQNYQFVDDHFGDPSAVPDDNLTYLAGKQSLREESYKMEQIDPAITGIYGFQWNPYGSIGNLTQSGLVPSTDVGNIAEYRHMYYNPLPQQAKRTGGSFELPPGPSTYPSNVYTYRTEFREWDLVEIEPTYQNNGAYINDSRFGFEIVTGSTPVGRISQAYIEIVLPEEVEDPSIPDPDSAPTPTVLLFKFAKLWNILLKNGTVYLFTNHNMDLVNPVDGLTYTPVGSLRMSALQRLTGLDPTNAEAQGMVATVPFNSLLAGLMRGAVITEYLVDWQYPWAGALLSTTNVVREMSFDGAKWSAELSSADRALLLPKGHVYGRTCRHVLGDEKCKVALDLLKMTEVTVIQIQFKKLQIFFSSPNPGDFGIPDAFGNQVDTDGYWTFGNLEWTSGPNEGTFHELRESIRIDSTGVIILLQVPTAFKITVGETANIWPGCDKVLSTCVEKFQNEVDGDVSIGNLNNYGGFPTIPGKDGLFAPLSEAKHVVSFSDFFDNPLLGLIGDILL